MRPRSWACSCSAFCFMSSTAAPPCGTEQTWGAHGRANVRAVLAVQLPTASCTAPQQAVGQGSVARNTGAPNPASGQPAAGHDRSGSTNPCRSVTQFVRTSPMATISHRISAASLASTDSSCSSSACTQPGGSSMRLPTGPAACVREPRRPAPDPLVARQAPQGCGTLACPAAAHSPGTAAASPSAHLGGRRGHAAAVACRLRAIGCRGRVARWRIPAGGCGWRIAAMGGRSGGRHAVCALILLLLVHVRHQGPLQRVQLIVALPSGQVGACRVSCRVSCRMNELHGAASAATAGARRACAASASSA